jgi:hypothetical protein
MDGDEGMREAHGQKAKQPAVRRTSDLNRHHTVCRIPLIGKPIAIAYAIGSPSLFVRAAVNRRT